MDSPYAPPVATSELSPGELALTARPKVIGVFAVLHFVFSGIGVLMILSSLVSFVRRAFSPIAETRLPAWPEAVMAGIYLITAALVLFAGLGLVRNRRYAIRATNRYAIASICGKVISVPLLMFPILQRVSSNLKNPGATVGVVFVFVLYLAISCLYPILCLTLLNRPRVKDWLAANGT